MTYENAYHFYCKYCERQFSSPHRLQRHCPTCGKYSKLLAIDKNKRYDLRTQKQLLDLEGMRY